MNKFRHLTAVGGLSTLLLGHSAWAQEGPAAQTDATAGGVIVVTGSAIPVAREQIGNSLSVVDAAAIEARQTAYLQDILREIPGVAVNQGGSFGSLSQVRIRGAEGNHTLVLIDGIEVSAVGGGEFDFSSLLAGNIERVEVLRGPQSGLYGSNALGGVISVVTKGGDGPTFDSTFEYGAFDTFAGRGALTFGDRETFLSGSLGYRDTDGFSAAANGTEPDGDRNLTTYLRGGARLSDAVRIDGTFRYVDKQSQTDGFDFSGGPLQGQAVDDNSFSNTRDLSGGVAVTIRPIEQWETVLTGAYTSGESLGGSGRTATFGNDGERTKFSGRTSYTVEAGSTRHSLTAFVEQEDESYLNTFPFDPSQEIAQKRSMLGFGGEYRLSLADSVFLRAAVRHDDNDRFQDATTYSVAGSWVIRASGTRLHASYGTGVTNPTFSEQFGFVPGTFVGNPNLTPEEAEGFDVGIEQRFWDDRALIDVTYFNSTLTNEIASAFPSVINQTGESDREGIEVTARVALGGMSLGGSYTYLSASDPDGTPEVRRPEHQASFDVSGKFGPGNRGTFSAGVIYNGEQFDNDFRGGFVAVKSPLDSYTLVRVAAAYRVHDGIELFGRIENAFDEKYQQNISYGTAGRAVYGGVRIVIP